MAKVVASEIQVQRQTKTAPEARINQYIQLLWVVAAGGLGITLLCVAASIGLADTNSSASEALQSHGIVDLAIANVNTAQALTIEAFSGILPAVTFFPSDTATFTPTFTITSTSSFTPAVTASRTSISLTRTHRPGEEFFFATSTQMLLPTRTNTSQPLPTSTMTFIPTETSTPSPVPTVITRTPRPTRTRTSTPVPVPTDTLTSIPATEVPPPTTEVPLPTTEVPPPTTEVPPPTTEVTPPTTEVPPPTPVTP